MDTPKNVEAEGPGAIMNLERRSGLGYGRNHYRYRKRQYVYKLRNKADTCQVDGGEAVAPIAALFCLPPVYLGVGENRRAEQRVE